MPRRLALFAVALGLRAPGLARESLWLDELSSVSVASMAPRDLLHHLTTLDVHPPLYFALLSAWLRLFGTSELAARSLSLLAGMLAVLGLCHLARTLLPPREAFAVLALAATSPFAVYYAREARSYSLVLALTALSLTLLVRALRSPTLARWGAFVVAATALSYTHVFGLLTVGGSALGLVALRHDRRSLAKAMAAYTVVAAAYLPWASTLASQVTRVERAFWIDAPDARAWLIGWLYDGPFAVAYVLLGLWCFARGARSLARELPRAESLALGGVLVANTALPLVVSLVSRPIFLAKYAIGALGVGLVVAARGASDGRVLLVLCALGCADAVRDSHLVQHRADWRSLAAFATELERRGEIAVLAHPLERHLAVYTGGRPVARYVAVGQLPAWQRAHPGGLWLLEVHPARTDPTVARVLGPSWREREVRDWFRARAVRWGP